MLNLPKPYATIIDEWYPILPESQLDKPFGFYLLNQALVLVRLSGQVVCFDDYCPHRHVPLSSGKSDGQTLQCTYHGWRFDVSGKAIIAPCLGKSPDVQLTRHACQVLDDWIWVNLSPNSQKLPSTALHCPTAFDSHDSIHRMDAEFIHGIENFLDPTHTPYVHQGLLRSQGTQRMHINQCHDERSFTTTYQLLDKQNGLINRLFDGGIDVNIAKFELPCLASIDYKKGDTLMYRIVIAFVPSQTNRLHLSVRLCIPKGVLPSRLKFALLSPFIKTLFKQDARILSQQVKYKRTPNIPYVICEQDLVIDHLLHLLMGLPEGVDKSGLFALQS